ncbi:MAG TPA: GTPase HflX [Candidatus Marinimicrobia bacterium]|nr:GTPase HflX [Candidatus Neomarinimicrobiota bacterium]HIM83825.1 GTPase HflX [Candidatus Neomarinimicrobiota bacterium]
MIERVSVAHEKAVLVGVILPGMTKALMEEHLDDLTLLAQTAGAEVVGRYIQRRDRINPTYFIGKGKAQQIVQQSQELDVQLIIFDDELSPSQIRNFLKISDSIKVIDRTGLILDIFQRHAQTRESKTQVELAHLQYLLPRLTRLWTHLERQMGGIGTRAGAGETQIEVDRRIIRDRIAKLRKDLKKIDKERETQSKRRKEMFRVALVGYTNAGKSTLLNALTGADVFVQDQLFATLDTTIRTLEVNDHHRLLLSDSVGFIRKLPHTLVASFRSTLMEVLEADLLLLMVDGSSYLLDEQLQTVREVLNEIGARDKEAMLVINKIDLIEDPEILQGLKARFPEAVFISALNHLRLDALQEAMVEEMEKSYRTAQVVFDPGLGKEIATVFQEVEVLDTSYEDDGVHLTIRGERVTVERLKALANRNGRKE